MIYLGKSPYYDEEKGVHCFIYKIGYTDDSSKGKRLSMYTSHNPGFKFLYEIPEGTEEHERRLHSKFRHLLQTGREWFKESEEILDFFSTATLADLDNLSPFSPKARSRRPRKHPKFEYSSTLPTDTPDDIKEFFEEYDKLGTYVEKIHFIVDGILNNPSYEDAIIGNLVDSDKIKQQLVTLGAARIRGLGYNITKINQAMGITIFDKASFVDKIEKEFKVGQRYSKKYIKAKLGEIYKSADFKGTPKASDLGEWFELKSLLVITDPATKKRENGFEILKKK